MTDIATVRVGAALMGATPANEGIRWLRRHLAWERTIQDCVERGLDAQLEAPDPDADQSSVGTSDQSRSSS